MAPAALAHLPQNPASLAQVQAPLRSHNHPSAKAHPQLSIIIVNFCQWKNTARLTQQLLASEAFRLGNAHITIVDNHSHESPGQIPLQRTAGVNILRSPQNNGFASAINLGSLQSSGEWILMLNPDVTVPHQFVDQILEVAKRYPNIDPKAGVIGFQLRNRDGSPQASSGQFPTLARTIANMALPRPRRRCQHQPLDSRRRVQWVTGGCMMVKRDCFQALHGLDESFFLYYEDVDFCRRALKQGWTVWYDPAVRVTHHFPLHDRPVPAPLRLVTRHSLLAYAKKHWPRWQTHAAATLIRLETRIRQFAALSRDDTIAATCFQQTRLLIDDVLHDRHAEAHARLRYAATFLDTIAAANDGRTS